MTAETARDDGTQAPADGRDLTAVRPRPPHKRVAVLSAGFAVLMLGAAYAAVPLYKLLCEVTGMGGTTQRAAQAPGAVGDATIRVRFNANVSSGLPWDFKPTQAHLDVRLGEASLANYQAQNRAVRSTSGTATFNVTPEIAGKYFSKIECFCFTEQALTGGQKVDMPVTFFVDPAILRDPDARAVREITLSYTFFALPAGRAGVAQRSAPIPADGNAGVVR